jgi:DNA-binding NarL/FixJ family response regulator
MVVKPPGLHELCQSVRELAQTLRDAVTDESERAVVAPTTTWKTPLFGREREMAALEAQYSRAADGQLGVVLIAADAGVGKSRLALEFLARHRRRTVTLSARSFPLGGTAPFGLWAEALEGYLRSFRSEHVVKLCGGFLDDLAVLLRSAAAARRGAPVVHEFSRARLLEGLAVLVSNLAAQAPVVALLDDIHFADASSWEALHYIAQNVPKAPVLMVAAARPAELAEGQLAAQVVGALERDERLCRLGIGPLDRRGLQALCAAVIGQTPPSALVDWLSMRTAGNPFYALSLLDALLAEGSDLTAPRLRSLPERVQDQVAGQLHLLDEQAVGTLELLAVVGRAVALNDVVRLAGRPFDRMTSTLERLARTRFILEEERAGELIYEIAHPILTEAIYNRIGKGRRVALHRLVGRTLRATGHLGEAAAHFARAAEPGDAEAISVLRTAVAQAEDAQAYREALPILSALVPLLPAGDPRWGEVLDAMSLRPEWVVDHRAEAHSTTGVAAMRSIDAVLDRGIDPARRAAVKFRLATLLAWGTGELDEAEDACRAAEALFREAGDEAGRLLAVNERAWIRGLKSDIDALRTGAERVVAEADAVGEPFVMVQALLALGYASIHGGRFTEADIALHQALKMSEDQQLSHQQSRILAHLGVSRALEGRSAEALALLDEAETIDPAYRDSLVIEFRGLALWLSGDYASALSCARESIAWNAAGISRRRGIGLLVGALSATEMDDPDEAQVFLDQARAVFGVSEWSYLPSFCDFVGGVLARQRHHPEHALEALQRSAAGMPVAGAWPHLAFVLVELGEIAAELGDVNASYRAARALDDVARHIDRALYHGLAALASAFADLGSGIPTAAVEHARRAVDMLSRTDCRGLRARALDALGRSLAGIERGGAVGALSAAAMAFEECSAHWRRKRSLEMLAAVGGTGRRAAIRLQGAAALTPRQRQVARLAAQGFSAREIAERLFIGERTVETHLANAYAKLGIESKIDLVRRAEEFGFDS